MAALTTSLPTEDDSKQRFVAPAPATPSVLTSIFDFAGNVASVADKAWTTLDRDKASGRAAADEAARNNAVRTIAATVLPTVDPAQTIPPQSMGAYNNSKPLATQAANTQTAANQGKIDPAMAQVKSIAAFRQALAANPGHEFAVFQAFKEMGVDNMMMQQYKNAESAVESDQNAQLDTRHALEKDAVTKYGYTDFYHKSPAEQATILATVGDLNAKEADLTAKTQLADLSIKQANLTQEQQKQVQTTSSQSLLVSATQYMTGTFGNLMKLSVNLLGDPTLAANPARQEQIISHLMNVGLPALDAQYQMRVAVLAPYMTPDDRTALDKSYQDQRKAFVDLISGPQSVVEMNRRVLTNITNSMNIDYAKAAPTLMNLQRMIGPQAVGVLLSPSIQGNKPLMDLLSQELRGAIADPSKMPSFTEFVQSLNGSVDPSTWDPEKSKALAPASLVATNRLAMDSPTMNGTDKDSHKALMNSIKQTAGIAVDVVPQWGFGNVLMQSKALNTRGVTNALYHTGSINQSEKIDAIHSWIPAVTRSYNVLSEMNSGDKYYTAKLDPHTLQWQAVWNGQTINKAGDFNSLPKGKQIAMGINPNEQIKPPPSSQVLEQVSTLNTMLNNLSQVAKSGYDDSLGAKAIPYNEARRYFATGEQPASLKQPTGKGSKTPEQNVDDAIAHAMDFVNKLTVAKPPENLTEHYATNPLLPVVNAAADKYNVPHDLALRLFHVESRLNPAVKDSPKGAVGLGQIMPATGAGYGVSDLHSLKSEENIDLALHILSDNYKRTGNWEDAISMYQSGRKLADAVKHKATDGNLTTSQYVAAVAGPSSITPDNLKRYGYVRF